MPRKTQQQRVYDYMKRFGSITSLQAFADLGVTRLADVIFKLKKAGVLITTEMVDAQNRFGDPVRHARYSLTLQDDLFGGYVDHCQGKP